MVQYRSGQLHGAVGFPAVCGLLLQCIHFGDSSQIVVLTGDFFPDVIGKNSGSSQTTAIPEIKNGISVHLKERSLKFRLILRTYLVSILFFLPMM